MKTMTCNQLGGACDMAFHAESFEEMANLSKKHGTQMYESGDQDHIRVMEEMSEKMRDPIAMQEWMEKKREEFEALPEDK
ncbi:MAG: DUF1059 domain-containing protein [Candidatus Levyibacteriota bacterium]